MDFQFDMVLHTEFGAFSLTDPIVERLHARGCKWVTKLGKTSSNGVWYLMADDEDDLRRDPDLIAVVRELQGELESRLGNQQSWRERATLERDLLHGLKVVTVNVEVEIIDHDGKETVRVHGSAG